MKEKFLDFLVDPVTKGRLELVEPKKDGYGIKTGRLRNAQGVEYPIDGGVPRFIGEDYLREGDGSKDDKLQTARSFASKWCSKLCEADKNKGDSRAEQFLAMLGVGSRDQLRDIFRDGMNCLNAGCGLAWSEYMFNDNPKVNRFAVDISRSVDVGYERTRDLDNVFIGQADLFGLPFKKEFFDIIYSDGVLHHTGDAVRAFNDLSGYLKPGGIMGIYIYCVKPFLRELADRELREVTTRMSFEECLDFSEKIALLGRSLQRIKEPLVIDEDIPLMNIKKGEYDLQKFIYDHFVKCYYNDYQGMDMSVITNVDWYHPKYATHHTREEVAGWFETNGFGDIKFVQPKGWEHSGFFVSGRKK
ncbi:MAG: methyltransferase domain-containing protein [Elusimicrobia bacterium]|nr:methyltransferase domain-containing protein [Elusimicrobiota bacterium]